MTVSIPPSLQNVKALVFDLMGTCTDWKTHVLASLLKHAAPHPSLASHNWDSFSIQWRMGFFKLVEILAAKQESGGTSHPAGQSEAQMLSVEAVYRQVLDELCERDRITEWGEAERAELNESWKEMTAWDDTVAGLEIMRKKYFLVALSNGSTRFLTEVNRKAGLQWDVLFASDLIGHFKPHPETYNTVIRSLRLKPEECAMVASHAYDLEAAAQCGMRTIYTSRPTEDVGLDLEKYTFGFREEGGFVELAKKLVGRQSE